MTAMIIKTETMTSTITPGAMIVISTTTRITTSPGRPNEQQWGIVR